MHEKKHLEFTSSINKQHLLAKMSSLVLISVLIPLLVAGAPTSAELKTFSENQVKLAANYDTLCFTCSVLLVSKRGQLFNVDNTNIGQIEAAIRVTKNYSGPKIQYLTKGALIDVNSGRRKVTEIDFNAFGFEVNTHTSLMSIGGEAKLIGAQLSASIFEAEVAVGVSSQIGIIDDSVEVKLLGTGCGIGRKVKCCVLDICLGLDFGKLFRP